MALKKAIFLFNESDVMPGPWLAAGYECWSFDGKHPEGITREGNHVKVGMWFHGDRTMEHAKEIAIMVGKGVEFIASFAECTYLTNTGAKWFYHPDDKHLPTSQRRPHPRYPNRAHDRQMAVNLAFLVIAVAERCNELNGYEWFIPWMLENPHANHLATAWRSADHSFHPFEYGGYLPIDDVHPKFPQVYPPRDAYPKKTGIWCNDEFVMPTRLPVEVTSLKDGKPVNPGWYAAGGRSNRTKEIRSITPRGFAIAVARANMRAEK
ncbi:hypothetical protein [Kosakonia phage Kc166B]|nr:hypothetical protein [Kosakonia phage Kc166B]